MSDNSKRRHEVVSSEKIAIPVRFKRPPTMAEQVAALVRSQRYKEIVEEQGFETFEEADDFDVGDDYDPSSPYEMDFDMENYSHEPPDQGRPSAEAGATPEGSGQSQEGVRGGRQEANGGTEGSASG